MDPMTLAALGLGAASLVSGLYGGYLSGEQQDQAMEDRKKAYAQWLAINVPDPKQQEIELEKFVSQGKLSPQMEKLIQQKPTEMNKITSDPTTRAAQIAALTKLQDISSQGGMDAQARQMQNEALSRSAQQERGQRGAILQNYSERGLGGSGAELAAQLMAQQGSANQAAMVGGQSAAAAQERALQALMGSANLGGSIRGQDFSQAQSIAQAQDEINRFNAAQSQGVAGRNTGTANNTQAANLAAAQALANANTGLANTEQQYNKELTQREYQNKLQQMQGAGNALNSVANQANLGAQTTSQVASGISGALGTAAGAAWDDGRKKKKDEFTDFSESDGYSYA